MQVFPERDRHGRRFLAIAVVLSLILHVAGGALWPWFARGAGRTVSPERLLAKLEPITIERRPKATPTPRPTPIAQGRPVPAKRAVVLPLARPVAAVPAYAIPTFAPRAEPSARPRKTAVHVPRSIKVAQIAAPSGANGNGAAGGALTQQQIAALDSTFRKTIDQAQAAAAAPPADPPSVPTMKRYNKLLDGSVTDVESGSGDCDALDSGTTRGAYIYYYLRCNVHYADGYTEQVSFPWPFRFTPRADPFAMGPGRHQFPPQGPPAGFSLPHPFALSRAVCAYYRDDCIAIIRREQGSTGAP